MCEHESRLPPFLCRPICPTCGTDYDLEQMGDEGRVWAHDRAYFWPWKGPCAFYYYEGLGEHLHYLCRVCDREWISDPAQGPWRSPPVKIPVRKHYTPPRDSPSMVEREEARIRDELRNTFDWDAYRTKLDGEEDSYHPPSGGLFKPDGLTDVIEQVCADRTFEPADPQPLPAMIAPELKTNEKVVK